MHGIIEHMIPLGRTIYFIMIFSALGSTSNPAKCPIGTYSNKTGNTQVTDCVDCTPGYYCETEGLIAPTGPCDEGIFISL